MVISKPFDKIPQMCSIVLTKVKEFVKNEYASRIMLNFANRKTKKTAE